MILLLAAAVWTGAPACQPCHAAQFARHQQSPHALALRPASALEPLFRGSASTRAGWRYRYQPGSVSVSGEAGAASMALEWAFGSGVQAVTALGRSGGEWIEHELTHFTSAGRLSLTPGHLGRTIVTPTDALGIRQPAREASRCFGCHATRVRPSEPIEGIEPGVQCERCHGPGSAHIEAAKSRDTARLRGTILNSRRFNAEGSIQVCGECHRTPDRSNLLAAPELDDPLSVRFQPVGLLASQCFQKGRQIQCLTCHNPHEPAVRADPGFYNAKCRSCHATPPAGASACERAAAIADCLTCHMPKVRPAPLLEFTDHRIRIRGAG